MQCSVLGKPREAWRLGTATSPTKGYSVVGAEQQHKAPTQPLPDPEVMNLVEAALGPLDTKPLVRFRVAGKLGLGPSHTLQLGFTAGEARSGIARPRHPGTNSTASRAYMLCRANALHHKHTGPGIHLNASTTSLRPARQHARPPMSLAHPYPAPARPAPPGAPFSAGCDCDQRS